MNSELRKLSSEELFQNTKDLVSKERAITLQVIENLEEIERRRLYLERGYSSLYEMCTKAFGYTESQAYRRISAMRLAREIPETKEKIQDGRLSLATVSTVSRFFNQEKKRAGKTYSKNEKKPLLESLEDKSKREVERTLAEISLVPEVKFVSKETSLPSGKTRVKLVLNEDQMKKLNRLRELMSHSIPDGEVTAVFDRLMDLTLDRLDPEKRIQRREARANNDKEKSGLEQCPSEVFPFAIPGRWNRTNPVSVRDQVMKRAGYRCEYIDQKTGLRCTQKRFIQLDHVLPWALGGGHDPENLQALCQSHNSIRARKTYGDRVVNRAIQGFL